MYEADIAKRYAEAVYGVAKEKDKVKETFKEFLDFELPLEFKLN